MSITVAGHTVEIDRMEILDELSQTDRDTVFRLTAQVFAQYLVEKQRGPSNAELRQIMTLIARYLIDPSAGSFNVQ